MKLPDNLKNTSGFGKGLPPARYVKGQEGSYSLSFQNEFDHAVWYAAGTPKTPGGRSDKQKEVLAWLMSQGLTFEEIKEHRNKILDVIRKQVKTSISEGSGDIDVPNVNPQFADKKEQEEDLLDDLPGDLAASLAAFAAKRGAAIPSETAEKAKKKSSYKSNTKLLGAITEKLSKIQGSLDAVAQSLDRQNALLQTNIQTNIAIVDSVVASNAVLETKFDALLAAFNEQAVASQQYYENLERAGREYIQDQQRDVAGSTSPIDLRGIKLKSDKIVSGATKRVASYIKSKFSKYVFGKKLGKYGSISYATLDELYKLRREGIKKLLQNKVGRKVFSGFLKDLDDVKEKFPRLYKRFLGEPVKPSLDIFQKRVEKYAKNGYGMTFNQLRKINPRAAKDLVDGVNFQLQDEFKGKYQPPKSISGQVQKSIEAIEARQQKVARFNIQKLLQKRLGLPKGLASSIAASMTDEIAGAAAASSGGTNIAKLTRRFLGGSTKFKTGILGRGGAVRGFSSVARRLPGLNTLLAGIDYGSRKAAGQTNLQAGAGVAAGQVGGSLGFAAGSFAAAKIGAALGTAGGPIGTIAGGLLGLGVGALGSWLATAGVDKITGADQIQYEQGSNNVGPSTDPAVIVGAAKSFVNQLGPMGEEVKVQFTPEIARLEKLFGAVDPNMESPVGGSIEGKQSPFNKKKTAGTIGDTESQDIDFDKIVPKGPLDDFLNFFKDTVKTVTDIIDKAKEGLNAVATEAQNLPSTISNALNLGAGNPNAPGNVYSAVLPQGNPVLTSPFGPRWGRQHGGIDIGVDRGSPVTSLVDGEVTYILPKFGEYGGAVFVKGADGMETVYGHVDATVKVGQKVKKGETVATVTYYPGSDGSDQTHLHLERRPAGGGAGSQVNPLAFVQQKGQELIDKKENTVPEGSFGISEKGKQQAEANKKEAQELKLTTDIPFQAPPTPPRPSFVENPQYYVDKLLDNFNAKPPQQPAINEPSPIDFPESSMFDVIVPTPMMNNATPQQNQQPIVIPASSNSVKQLNNLRLAQ